MHDYDCKEDVSSPPSPATSKSITTTIEFMYAPTPSHREINVNKINNKLRLTTTTSSVSEDMKSNDASYHGCESPTAVLSSSSSSLLSSQAEDSIETPIISNRPMQREAPPLLCLPPTLSSPNHLSYEYSSNVTNNIHRTAATAVHAQMTTSTNKSPRFSSINDTPIIMSGNTLERWTGRQNKTTTSSTNHATLLSERLPTIVDLVAFSNHDDNCVSASTLTTGIVRYGMELFVRAGFLYTMNRIKRTLLESNARELRQRHNFNNNIKYDIAVVAPSSNEHQRQNNSSARTTTAPPNCDLNARKKKYDETDNKSILQRTPVAKAPKPNNSKSDALPTSLNAPISASVISNRSVRRVVGIRNYGQTCFLNSVIQALASLDPFIMYLERIVQINVRHRQFLQMSTATSYLSVLGNDEDITGSNDSYLGRMFQSSNANTKTATSRPGTRDQTEKSLFCEDMLNLLLSVNGEKQQTSNRQWIDPRSILLAVGQKHKQFQRRYGGVGIVSVGEQQDAQELLQAVLGMIIDEGQFDLTPPAVPSTMMSSFDENNNLHNNLNFDGDDASTMGDESSFLHKNISIHSMSKAIEIMMTTTSSTSPCPLSVWCGSAIMCATCRRVRPIQNVPFLDIPIIPTSISHQMMYPPQKGQGAPSCRLEDCLSEFTAIERVFDVECKNCTIQEEISEREAERDFQLQIIEGIRSRQCKTSAKSSSNGEYGAANEMKHVLDDLLAIEAQLEYLRRLSPDDDSQLYKGINSTTTIVRLEETTTTPIKIPLKRSDAFKCLLLTRLPSVLSIHVQRRYFDPNTGKTSKTMQHINFPEMLDISSFCAYGAPQRHHSSFAGSTNRTKVLNGTAASMPIWYKLMAVIEHRGGPYSGHYVCYRRDPTATREDRWLLISDDVVRVCQWSHVRSCQAYMLFYEAT